MFANTISAKNKKGGLPQDAARDFFKNHAKRLTILLEGPGTNAEKVLYRQRKSTLKVVEKCYIELQGKALGLTPPDIKKDIKR